MKTALLTYTGMENGKIRTVFSAILHFKKPAHRSVAPEYALAIATSSTHARDFSQAAALPTQLCLMDQRWYYRNDTEVALTTKCGAARACLSVCGSCVRAWWS